MTIKQINFEILTGRSETHLSEYENLFVHSKLVLNFEKLKRLAEDEIGASLAIVSGFRSFERQLLIWNEKFNGIRKVKNEHGTVLNLESMSELEKIKSIMRFSAIPGASRHHWGSDIDVYDSELLDIADVELTPKEVEKGGVFFELHDWLTNKIDLNESYDFYRPYNEDLGGIYPEAWHLSLKTLSQDYYQAYTLDIFKQNIHESDMAGKETLLDNCEEIFKTYIQNIHLP